MREPGGGQLISLSGVPTFPTPPKAANRNAPANASAWGGGGARKSTSFWGPKCLSCSFLWGSRRPTSSNLLPPGPPLFIFSPIPACLFGVGLKGAGWTRTENDMKLPKLTKKALFNFCRWALSALLPLSFFPSRAEICYWPAQGHLPWYRAH